MPRKADEKDPYEEALTVIQGGDFEEIKTSLQNLGFKLVEKKNSDHWMYYHPELKGDPIFAYPRNLYQPHGAKRDCERVSRRDSSQAKQMVQALKALREAGKKAREN